jgi:hypothetical protein
VPLLAGREPSLGEVFHVARLQGGKTVVFLADATGGGFIALWALLYLVLLIFLGVLSLRKGHWLMFIIGIFVPLFWFIGALLPRRIR